MGGMGAPAMGAPPPGFFAAGGAGGATMSAGPTGVAPPVAYGAPAQVAAGGSPAGPAAGGEGGGKLVNGLNPERARMLGLL